MVEDFHASNLAAFVDCVRSSALGWGDTPGHLEATRVEPYTYQVGM